MNGEESKRKTVRVSAAIIKKENQILATQRGYGKFKDGWEFPGGKIEEGETPQQALTREIKEELDAEIEIGELIDLVEYDYPDFHLTMYCYMCTLPQNDAAGGKTEAHLVLKEHEAARWLTKENIDSVEWLPADLDLVKKIRDHFMES